MLNNFKATFGKPRLNTLPNTVRDYAARYMAYPIGTCWECKAKTHRAEDAVIGLQPELGCSVRCQPATDSSVPDDEYVLSELPCIFLDQVTHVNNAMAQIAPMWLVGGMA